MHSAHYPSLIGFILAWNGYGLWIQFCILVMSLSKRLSHLGYELPALTVPLAAYLPAKCMGNMVFISGQLPLQNGKLLMEGPLTKQSNLVQSQKAMACCFLNGLAAAGTVVDLEEIKGVLRLGAYVASSDDFYEQHLVANGASEMAQQIFASEGQHIRFAVGVSALPLNSSVELELTFYCN